MATVLNFEIEQSDNARKLIFKETTGAYDASLNTDGWGSPNEATSDAIAASTTLTITTPGGTATVYDNTDITGLTSFPTTDTGLELEILASDLGGAVDAQHTDGVYTIKYTIVTSLGTYTTEHKIFISGAIRCCVYKMLAAVDADNCGCDSTEKVYALEAYTFYRALLANAACGNETGYTDLLAVINKLCSNNRC